VFFHNLARHAQAGRRVAREPLTMVAAPG